MTDLVPGELRGYRRFRLDEHGLHPTVHAGGGPWSAATTYAVCAAGEEHAPPARDCACGLYGWYSPRDVDPHMGFGNVTAVVAASGRTVLGDHGFRAAAARIEAVAARPRWHAALQHAYPSARVYASRRAMLRDHPPHDVRALGITARPSAARRFRTLFLVAWLVGGAAPYALLLLPAGAVRPLLLLPGLALLLVWQVLLIVLAGRSTVRPSSWRGAPGP